MQPRTRLLLLLAPLSACTLALAALRPPQAAATGPQIEPLPPTLAATGLYADAARQVIAADVLPFTPQYPLWSDGAAKRRWIRLPAGKRIDATDPTRWHFPIGTRLWKEFAFGTRVETRFLERVADGTWRFAAYQWNADGSEAVLAPESGVRGVRAIAPGVAHDIPGRLDCLACHGGRADPVLGFNALQLSPDRDPLAPHAETPSPGAIDLPSLRRAGLLRETPEAATAPAPRIAARSPRERAALGYLQANCAACHTAERPLADLGLNLDAPLVGRAAPDDAVAGLTRPARFRLPGAPDGALARLEPGHPERSLLLLRPRSRNAATQMPPLGTHLRDEHALTLLEAWIREDLAAPTPPPSTPKE